MTLPPLLQLSYWFDLTPPPFLTWVERGLLAIFVILLCAGIFVRLVTMRQGWEKMTKSALQQASSMLTLLGALGLLLYTFSYERVYLLSMRFGYLLWLALLVWYAWRLYRLVMVEMPAMEQRRTERDAINKWLPKGTK